MAREVRTVHTITTANATETSDALDVRRLEDLTFQWNYTDNAPSNATFTDEEVNDSANQITITSHGYVTGLDVVFTTGGTAPSPLVASTTYYVISVDANTLKLATSLANASAGTAIDITDQGIGQHTLTPSSYSAAVHASGEVETEANQLWQTAHGLTTGDPGQLTTTGTLPTGLSLATDYWVIKSDNDKYKLASSAALAQAGTAIDITGLGSGDHTFTPNAAGAAAAEHVSGAIDSEANTMTKGTHGIITGVPGQFTTDGTLPTGLSALTTYWAIAVDADTLSFATSLANAIATTAIDFTDNGSGTQTFTPIEDGAAAAVHASGEVDTENNKFAQSTHGFDTGVRVQATTDGTLPGGLAVSTDYYVISLDADNFQVASSAANASAGTAVDILTLGSGDHTFTQVSFAAAAHASGDIDVAGDSFAETSHGFVTGSRVQVTTDGTLPGGISAETDYYVMRTDANNFQIATSFANATTATPVTITDVGIGNQTFTQSTPPSAQTFVYSDVAINDDAVVIASHGFATGEVVQVSTSDTLPGGLSASTDYWIISLDSNTIQFATSANNAAAGTQIDLTAVGVGTQTITPVVYSAKTVASGGVDASDNSLYKAAHGFATGDVGQIATDDTLPTGYSALTDYFVIRVDADNYKLATSLANAVAGTAVAITDIGAGTQTFTPETFAAAVATSGAVDTENDKLYKASHGYVTGIKGQITTDDTEPTGISLLTDYFTIVLDDDHYQLATSAANARDGVAVDITALGSGNHTFTEINYTAAAVASGAIDTENNSMYKATHGFTTGLKGQIATDDTLPTGYSAVTDYYVIAVDANNYKLATSFANASAGTAIDITDTGAGTQTFTPTSISAVVSTSGAVDTENNKFYKADHGLATGTEVQIATSDTLPTGVSGSTDYWVISLDDDNYQLASSLANAVAGTAIDITDIGVGNQTVTPEYTEATKTFDSGVAIGLNSVLISAHEYLTGDHVQLTTTGTLPTGLATGTDYYIIKVDANFIKFASSLANALAGTAVDITAFGSGTHTVSVQSASATWKLQGTIEHPDNAVWTDLASGSATISGSGTKYQSYHADSFEWVRAVLTVVSGNLTGTIKVLGKFNQQ